MMSLISKRSLLSSWWGQTQADEWSLLRHSVSGSIPANHKNCARKLPFLCPDWSITNEMWCVLWWTTSRFSIISSLKRSTSQCSPISPSSSSNSINSRAGDLCSRTKTRSRMLSSIQWPPKKYSSTLGPLTAPLKRRRTSPDSLSH